MKRKIININSSLCNGCSLCVDLCREKALDIINMKAVLAGDEYCSSCGKCIEVCPHKALTLTADTSMQFNKKAVEKRLMILQNKEYLPPLKKACTASQINARTLHPERFSKK